MNGIRSGAPLPNGTKDDPARAQRRDSRWLSHEQVLLSSPFSRLEAVSFIGRQFNTVDSLIERARSMSSLSRQQIGEQSDHLERDLRTLLAGALSGDGFVAEVLEWTALIARREKGDLSVGDASSPDPFTYGLRLALEGIHNTHSSTRVR
jgi:hypothetical protein